MFRESTRPPHLAYTGNMARTADKIAWSGCVRGVQPRIRLNRSFDQSQHSYLGYVLILEGEAIGLPSSFRIALGKGAHARHGFRVGNRLSGLVVPVTDAQLECADLYRASGLRLGERGPEEMSSPPQPIHGIPPELEVHRQRAPAIACAHLFQALPELHLGLRDGGRDDHRSVESQAPALPARDLLLWTQELPPLPPRTYQKGPWAQRDELGRGRLD